jgi:hypothetical protein
MALPPSIFAQCILRLQPRSIVAAEKQACVHYWRAVDQARRHAAPPIEFRQIDGRNANGADRISVIRIIPTIVPEPEQQQVAEGGDRFADDSLRTRQDGYPGLTTTGEKEYAS